MKISQVEFCSLFSYCPHSTTVEAEHARNYTYALKNDRSPTQIDPFLMPEYIADKLQQIITVYPFNMLFKHNTILVPVPGHSLMKENSLWVPKRIATVLESRGWGRVFPYLYRCEPSRQSSKCLPQDRPDPQEHYDSIAIRERDLSEPEEILLIDDVIAQGATVMGCANRLNDLFPKCNIRAFAAVRVISQPDSFKKFYAPYMGVVALYPNGKAQRSDNRF